MSFTLQVYPVPRTAPSVPFTDEVVAQVPPPSRPRRMVDRLRRRRDNESASYLSNDGLRERREYAASPVWSASTNTLTIRVHGASMIVLDEATDITIQADEVLNVVVKPQTRSEGGVLEITHVCLSTITTSATPWRVSVACTTASALQELHTLAKLIFNAAFPFGPRHYIALAAPTSGSGRGPARWEALCETLLQHTPHTWTTVLTTHRCHAEELAATMDLRAMDVLVAVGGDGMVHEVVNGFAKRTTPLPSDGCPHVAHLPAGSGCAFAKCFNMVDQVVAMLGMIHCKSRAVDVIDVTITDNNGEVAEKRKITLAALFSVMAAVDFESEWLRALGNGRFIVDVVRRVLGARIFYPAHVSYKPATLLDIPRKYWLDPTIDDATAAAIRLDGIEAIAKNLYKLRFNGEAHTFPATSVSDADSAKAPPLNERGWVDIPHDSFALLYVCNLPWVAQDWLAAPFARSDDGCIDLHYTNVSLTRLQWTWAIPDFMSGECVAHRRNRLVKCKEVIVDLCEGYGSLDGERCPLGKLHFRCLGDRIDIMTGLTAVP